MRPTGQRLPGGAVGGHDPDDDMHLREHDRMQMLLPSQAGAAGHDPAGIYPDDCRHNSPQADGNHYPEGGIRA